MDGLKPDAPLDCAEVVRNLWEYLDRRANPELVDAIDEHLARCVGCQAHFEFERRLVTNLAALRGRHSDPARLRNEVLEVLREAGVDESKS
jgi:anti-sigma factor (TIGR02949 family)